MSLCCSQVVLGGVGRVLVVEWLVEGLGFEHGEDDVAASAGDADPVANAWNMERHASGHGTRGTPCVLPTTPHTGIKHPPMSAIRCALRCQPRQRHETETRSG